MTVENFATNSDTYEFRIDDNAYVLPVPSWGDYERALKAAGKGPTEQFEFATALLETKASPEALSAIKALPVASVSSLFAAWLGFTQGESSSSRL